MAEPDEKEKEGLWWFANTDGSARVLHGQIEVQVGSPDPYLIQLYCERFGRWAETRVVPRLTNSFTKEKWYFNVLLPEFHQYLLSEEPLSISWESIAILINTEGSIVISPKRGKARTVVIITNTRRKWLLAVMKWLLHQGVSSRLRKRRLCIERRNSVEKLLRQVIHDLIFWKRLLAKLALTVNGEPWEYVETLVKQVKAIKQLIFKASKREIRRRIAESPPPPKF